jgi:light-regulated signal transduction histidine kinase (bacteriophytochrome)
LDDEGKRITRIITSSAQKMGHLIDDLLEFSRTGKQPLQKFLTNMQKTVTEIIEEIAPRSQNIVWNIGNLHDANVDSRLFRQVWYNLISNAIKYSSKNDKPEITIGSKKTENKTVYYVRDNGVGFDPNYKHKLFKVFQRLHDPEEYEGTGVGLALVEKIISRHGGNVWAEAEENKGASFYFSLTATT